MALDITVDGFNPDGSPHLVIVSDGHVVVTGPISGQVTTSDGTRYDVSAPFIEVASEEHALEVSDAIGALHVENGHPDFVNDPLVDSFGFVHVDSQGVEHVSQLATGTPTPVDAMPVPDPIPAPDPIPVDVAPAADTTTSTPTEG